MKKSSRSRTAAATRRTRRNKQSAKAHQEWSPPTGTPNYADLSEATSVTIQQLRESLQQTLASQLNWSSPVAQMLRLAFGVRGDAPCSLQSVVPAGLGKSGQGGPLILTFLVGGDNG